MPDLMLRRVAATLLGLAEQLERGGSAGVFVAGIRADGEFLRDAVAADEHFETCLRDVNRQLPGRRLGSEWEIGYPPLLVERSRAFVKAERA